MTESVPYRSLSIRRVLQRQGALWHRHVSTEVSSVQYGVLYFLSERGELPQRELMRLSELDKSSLAELLRRMELQGTVATRRDREDKRRKTVAVTEQGRQLYDELRPAALRVNDLLTAALSTEEETTLDTLLAKLLTADESADTDTEAATAAGPAIGTDPAESRLS